MKFKIVLLSLFVLFSATAFGQNKHEAEVIKFDRLQQLISKKNESVQVINFWATWCAPCIKELPYFQSLPDAIANRNVNVTLISLDFVEKLNLVNKFIERKEITRDVLLLDNIDYNSWIDQVDPSWTGAIPATLIVDSKTGTRKFIEGELEEGQLEKILTEFLKP